MDFITTLSPSWAENNTPLQSIIAHPSRKSNINENDIQPVVCWSMRFIAVTGTFDKAKRMAKLQVSTNIQGPLQLPCIASLHPPNFVRKTIIAEKSGISTNVWQNLSRNPKDKEHNRHGPSS